MKRFIILALAAAASLAACDKEEAVNPSDKDNDWYRISQDQTTPLGKLRYQVYAQTGVPIFYSDTIGSQVRRNMAGEPYTYYEILKPGYRIGSSPAISPISFDYVTSGEALIDGVELLRDRVIPRLKASYLPACFVMTDALRAGKFEKAAYRDYTATYTGRTSAIAGMDESGREQLAWDIVGAVAAPFVIEKFSDRLALFYRKTDQSVNQSKYETLYGLSSLSAMFDPWLPAEPYDLGFLAWSPGFYISTISRTMDVEMFISLVYSLPEPEVEARYGDYPVVMEKYRIMRDILADFDR